MDELISRLLPKVANNNYKGYRFTEYIFLLITIITIVRSLIHLVAPDGGAYSIATIDLNVEGSSVIIGIFAMWGLSQLIMGIFYVIIYFRYKNLIPLMYVFILIEYLMRILIGTVKPFETMGTPPGAIGNVIFVPLAIVMLFFSIKEPKK